MKPRSATIILMIFTFILMFLCDKACGDSNCPEGTTFSQPPHYPEDQANAQCSDDGPEEALLICDNFTGVDNIDGIHFWGMHAYADYSWFPCSEDPMTFEIIFYIDSLSSPGREVASYTVILDAVATGVYYYSDFELMEYTASFPTVALSEGWVSVQGKGNPSCWFMWLSSRESFDNYSIKYGDGTSYLPYDFAFCLLGTASCCNDFTGNADCAGPVEDPEQPDISDIVRIIDFLYLSHDTLCCLEEADVDGSGPSNPEDPLSAVDISDIVFLIDHLYLSHKELVPCP